MDKSVYFKNGGIRVKDKKLIINVDKEKEFINYDDVLYIEIMMDNHSNEILLKLGIIGKVFILEGETFLEEDVLIVKKEIEKIIDPRRKGSGKAVAEARSISEHYIFEGDVHGQQIDRSSEFYADDVDEQFGQASAPKKRENTVSSMLDPRTLLDDGKFVFEEGINFLQDQRKKMEQSNKSRADKKRIADEEKAEKKRRKAERNAARAESKNRMQDKR